MSKKNCNNPCNKKTSIGGQALIEGIMMRGPKVTAMAVRNPEGELVLEKWQTSAPKRAKLFRLPVIRGVFNFIDSMVMGYKSLMRSAEIAGLEEEEPKKAKKKADSKIANEPAEPPITEESSAEADDENVVAVSCDITTDVTTDFEASEEKDEEDDEDEKTDKKGKTEKSDSALMTGIMLVATVLGVGLAILLFIMLPTFLYNLLSKPLPFLAPENELLNSLVKSVFEGVLRIIVLVVYMLAVRLMKDIRRTFMYHGAEHKTIFCYENGLELTVENVRAQRRFHPRCGTSFLILMLLVGIIISFFINPISIAIFGSEPNTVIRTLIKVLLLPLTMGVGYELIKLAGRRTNLFTRIISAPGMWLQRITVLEPDDDMIECAIKAFKEVIPEDESDKY